MTVAKETRASGDRLLTACLLGGLALIAAVFAPGIGEEFAWDDHGLIRTNAHIQRSEHHVEALTSHFWNISSTTAEANDVYTHLYRPVVTLAYIVQFRLFGDDATGYRAFSLALHLLCCALFYLWLRRRLPHPQGREGAIPLLLALGLFGLHPSRVEAVSWISGSTELWWCVFLLAASLALDGGRRWTAGLLLSLALLSKETAIVAMPLLLLDRWLREDAVDRHDVVALALPVIAAFALRTSVVGLGPADAVGEGAAARVLASAGLYLQQVALPLNPTAFRGLRLYSCEAGETLSLEWLLWGGALALGVSVLAFGARGRPSWRPPLADALFFILPLLPVMNLLDLGSRNLTADRFIYAPLMGVAALLARSLVELEAKRLAIARILEATLAIVLLGFALITSIHTTTFASSSTLWEYELERQPENALALHSVGAARVRAGLHLSGLALLERSFVLSRTRCVHADQVRAAGDLGWAMAVATPAEERASLQRLARAYEELPSSRTLSFGPSRGSAVELDEAEVIALVAQSSRFAEPYALVLARLGRVEDAIALLEPAPGGGGGDGHAEALRTLFVASRGDEEGLRERIALAPPPPGSDVAIVLDALASMLPEVPPEQRRAVASFALGFGTRPPSIDALAPGTRADAMALRAATSPGLQAPIRSRDPRLAGLLAARERIRALDIELTQDPLTPGG